MLLYCLADVVIYYSGEHRLAHPCNKRPDKAVAQCSKCAQMVLAAVAEGLTLEQTVKYMAYVELTD